MYFLKNQWMQQFTLGVCLFSTTAAYSVEIQTVEMSDAAAQGVGCFFMGTSSLAAAYALGPTELMMLATGAVIVPSSSSLLFIALGGILGAGACSVGASLTPAVLWAKENKASLLHRKETTPPPQAMTEAEVQSTGCLAGVLGFGAITLAAAPTEIVMLAAGGVTSPSSTSLLLMGILGTVVPASCTVGAAAALPVVAVYDRFDLEAVKQKITSIFGFGSPAPALAESPSDRLLAARASQ